MSELRIIDNTGDTKLIWNKENEDEVENAERTFDDLKAKGFGAYAVKESGKKGSIIYSFDPDAEKIIMAPPLRGG